LLLFRTKEFLETKNFHKSFEKVPKTKSWTVAKAITKTVMTPTVVTPTVVTKTMVTKALLW
jgi:hypothetical protein